jgi:hypothetical protein
MPHQTDDVEHHQRNDCSDQCRKYNSVECSESDQSTEQRQRQILQGHFVDHLIPTNFAHGHFARSFCQRDVYRANHKNPISLAEALNPSPLQASKQACICDSLPSIACSGLNVAWNRLAVTTPTELSTTWRANCGCACKNRATLLLAALPVRRDLQSLHCTHHIESGF